MPQPDLLKRYIDAGLAFTSLTQTRAEALVKDLVKAGELQADQARDTVADLLERSRKNSEKLLETVRTEVRQQITSLGIATQEDLDRIEERIASLLGTAAAPVKKATAKSPVRKAAKKTAAKKTAAKKTAAKKAPARKAAAKKAPAKKAPAKKKAAARKAPANKAVATPAAT
jgi:polyhydroxyalkanoate synthesis regulator phasin